MATHNRLIRRAQRMCDADGRTRWVKLTSLGWRIELEPGAKDAPCTTVAPQTDKPKETRPCD